MTKEVGLWIDRRRAYVVTIENKKETIKEITSNVEKKIRFGDGSRSKKSDGVLGSSSEDAWDRQFQIRLETYYDQIVPLIRGADAIYIFGPGEAKDELANHINRKNLKEQHVIIEAADKLTDNQILSKVRARFAT